ncbi:MAG: rhodanese-like domain-containing protein, partial [Clostridia bacterium]|nr:rhodanese-like domain-containing protein [Clostridia bacterium]
MKHIVIYLIAALFLLTACTAPAVPSNPTDEGSTLQTSYQMIDQEEAKRMMEQDNGHIVVDVRRIDEYESGHIPGAICIPNETIGSEMPNALPNLEQVILVYCRSGNR